MSDSLRLHCRGSATLLTQHQRAKSKFLLGAAQCVPVFIYPIRANDDGESSPDVLKFISIAGQN